jgi:chaperonin GroES
MQSAAWIHHWKTYDNVMKITPRGKYILIKRDEAESPVSEHGIVAPDSIEREQKAYGTVIAVGDEIKDVKKGDRVIFGAFAGETVEQTEKGKKVEYKLVESEFVIAFIQD